MTNRNRPASRGKAPLMAVWGIERRRVSNLGIQSRKDNGGKIFGSNESVGFDSDVGRKRLSDKKKMSRSLLLWILRL